MLVDTHCHIHEADYELAIADVLQRAHDNGVNQLLCVGTSIDSSRRAIDFAKEHLEAFATVGVHPHDTKDGWEKIGDLLADGIWKIEDGAKGANSHIPNSNSKIVAIGEIGLDYYYNHSPRDVQIKALEWQIDLALRNDLPIIFHVREASSAEKRESAYNDFWSIFDNFKGIRGELHSFTDNEANLTKGLERGLFIGVNGISTFTKDAAQKELFASIPLDKLLLETDAPFLTPVPHRGKVNEPAYVKSIAESQAVLRGISFDAIAKSTTANAHSLFSL